MEPVEKESKPGFRYQVVCTDRRDFIEGYNHFYPREIDAMLKYINRMITKPDVVNIKITTWNEKGERL
jgi:hypothetical protein